MREREREREAREREREKQEEEEHAQKKKKKKKVEKSKRTFDSKFLQLKIIKIKHQKERIRFARNAKNAKQDRHQFRGTDRSAKSQLSTWQQKTKAKTHTNKKKRKRKKERKHTGRVCA